VKLVSPLGFIPLSEKKKHESLSDRLKAVRVDLTSADLSTADFEISASLNGVKWRRKDSTVTTTDSEQPPTETSTTMQEVTVQPMETYRVSFNMQAGRRIGLIPRPDTYTISVDVIYTSIEKTTYASTEKTTHHKQLSRDISIFPPIAGMLAGTLLGSFLGTMIKNIQSPNLEFLLPILLTNLTLAFIVGVILMRKKDVQPFVTVEDFWGGILLGFLVGFGGQALFEQITGINLVGNATSTAG
jgi:hypothetical protein